MGWHQLVMILDSLDPDRVEEAFLTLGALAVTLSDAGDDPVLEPPPGETPLWSQTKVTVLFSGNANLKDVPQKLQTLLDVDTLPSHHFEELDDRQWEREWLKDFGPMRFGERLWIVPGDDPAPDPDGVIVRLDPGLAFGTGTHATTALCLEWLERTALGDKTVFDFGCGSGILGVAALKLGARHVLAVDIDAQAVAATRENATRNAVDRNLVATKRIEPLSDHFDIVVANILAGTLVDNVDLIRDTVAPGGRLALSGILAGEADEISETYRQYFDLDERVSREEWVLVSGRKL